MHSDSRFAPRKESIGWLKLNKSRVEMLIATGLMSPAGLAKIEAVKQDGSWNALDKTEALEIPLDLEKAFAANKTAEKVFHEFPRSVKLAPKEWIAYARKSETREKRIQETVTSAVGNIHANHWRQ